MRWYLVERDFKSDDYSVQSFRDSKRALAAYGKRESELDWSGDVRVCLFRADSLDTLKQTHGSWFYSLPELLSRFAEVVSP